MAENSDDEKRIARSRRQASVEKKQKEKQETLKLNIITRKTKIITLITEDIIITMTFQILDTINIIIKVEHVIYVEKRIIFTIHVQRNRESVTNRLTV